MNCNKCILFLDHLMSLSIYDPCGASSYFREDKGHVFACQLADADTDFYFKFFIHILCISCNR